MIFFLNKMIISLENRIENREKRQMELCNKLKVELKNRKS